MRYLARTVVGLGLLSGSVTATAYGIAQLIEIGSCGTDDYGRPIGPPCPSGTAWVIVIMVVGSFVGIFGAGLYATRGNPEGGERGGFGMGVAIGQLRFWAAMILAGGAAAAIGIVDLHEDEFRPGMEIVAAGAGSVLLVQILGFLMFGRSSAYRGVPGVPGSLSSGPRQPPPRGNLPLPPPPPSGAEMTFPPPATQTPVSAGPLPPAPAPAPPGPPPSAEGGFAGLGTDSVADSGLPGIEQTSYGDQASELEHADLYRKLDDLAELRRNGALTDEQYEAARTNVLNQL